MKITGFFTAAVFLLSSCGGCSLYPGAGGDRAGYVFLSYNVCNLFDDTRDGTEYPEYDPSRGGWTTDDYRQKLDRVGRAIAGAVPGGPDFAALMEIENDRVLEDLRSGPLRDLGYLRGCTFPEDTAPVRVGVLSRFPILEARGHIPASAGFPQRGILEVVPELGGLRLHVFVCHFKSKSEGAQATETSRILAAQTLRGRIAEIMDADPDAEILVLGDLNENADEFERIGERYPTALMPAGEPGASEGLAVTGSRDPGMYGREPIFHSPWLDDPPHPGSYLYRDRWETLDHVLVTRGLLDGRGLTSGAFGVVRSDYLLSADGSPVRDYSDHLPVYIRIDRAKEP